MARRATKPKTAAGSGEHWVTINGTHVLVDGSGTPVDPKVRDKLAGDKPAASGPTLAEQRTRPAAPIVAAYDRLIDEADFGAAGTRAAATWVWAAQNEGVSLEQERADIGATIQDALDHSKVAVRVSPTVLDRIVEAGRMKNQFETGTSQGVYDPSQRRAAEGRLFNVPPRLPVQERPIYGYMESTRPGEDVNGPDYYGSVRVILKDSVRARTTVTMRDSLTMDVGDRSYGKGKYLARAVPVDHADWTMVHDSSGVVRALAYLTHERKAGRSQDQDPWSALTVYRFEAQIHGGVSVDDIERVVVPKTMTDGYPVVKALKKRGIKVDRYDPEAEKPRDNWELRDGDYPTVPWRSSDTEAAKWLKDKHKSVSPLPAAERKSGVWRTINHTPVLIGGDGKPVSQVWRERLSGGGREQFDRIETVDAAMHGALSTAMTQGYAMDDPRAMTARAVTTSEEERRAAAKRLDSAYEAAKRVPLKPGQDEAWVRRTAAVTAARQSEQAYLMAAYQNPDPKTRAKAQAEMFAAQDASRKAWQDYQAHSNAAETMAAIERHRPPGTEVDPKANLDILKRQVVADDVPHEIKSNIFEGQLWYADHLSTAALKERVASHNWDWDGSDRPGVPPVRTTLDELTVGGSFNRGENVIRFNRNIEADPDMMRGAYVHEMAHWLSDTPRGSWAQSAVFDRATGKKVKVLGAGDLERQVLGGDGTNFSVDYAHVAYQTKVGRRWVTHSTETASTAVEDLYRDPWHLAQEDKARFKLAVALLWGDAASLESLIEPPASVAKPRRRKEVPVADWLTKRARAAQGGTDGVSYPDPARAGDLQPGERPLDGGRAGPGGGAQHPLYLWCLHRQGRADERLAHGEPGRRDVSGDGDGQYPGPASGGDVLSGSAAPLSVKALAWRARLLRLSLTLEAAGLATTEAVKVRRAAKPKAKPPSGQRWVTIRGTHVLVTGSGTPVSPTWQARLHRKPKAEGGPPVGLEVDPATDPNLADLRAMAEADTAQALVKEAGLSKAAAKEQARWEHMPFEKSSDLGGTDHVNQVLVVEGHDAAGQAMKGVFKPPPSGQAEASIESSLAYYGMDQLLGTGVVPPTVLRTVGRQSVPDAWSGGDQVQGTLQQFVPGFKSAYSLEPTSSTERSAWGGPNWGFGSESEIVRYQMATDKSGLNVFQKDLIERNPDNSRRLQAAMVLDTIMGNVDRHNGNWGVDKDGRLWLTDNDTGNSYNLSENQPRRNDKAPLTMTGVRSFMKNDAQGFAIPKDWLKRWKGIKREQFDAALRSLDDVQDYRLTDSTIDRDHIWDNFQAVIRHGRIDGEDTFGDTVVEAHFP